MKQFDHSRDDFEPYGFTCERWTPARMTRPDRHSEIEANIFEDAGITYLFRGSSVEVSAFRFIIFWAAIPHQIISYTGHSPYFVITIPLSWFLRWPIAAPTRDSILQGRILQQDIRDTWSQESANADQWTADLESTSIERKEIALLEIEARLRRLALSYESPNTARPEVDGRQKPSVLGTENPNKAEAIACYLARNYHRKISVAEIAKNVGLHPNYAMTLFKKSFHLSINEYLVQHRLSHAQRLLATTDEKILSVAYASGFATLSRFNEAFKKAFQCTPREYRAANRIA